MHEVLQRTKNCRYFLTTIERMPSLGMLVDIEYSNRKNNRQKRLIRNAGINANLKLSHLDM